MTATQAFIAKVVDMLPVQLASNRWREVPGGWPEAKARARGYDDPAIVDKVVAATRLAAANPDVWERDSVVFRGGDPHWQILSSLLYAWSDASRTLRVSDFGGSLGSLWWRHRGLLSARGRVSWTVVEQPLFVAAGAEFANEHLAFSDRIPESVDVLLASGVLCYLESPYERLASFAHSAAPWLLLDKVPLIEAPTDRPMVQNVHPRIYSASYPCWFFSRERFEAAIAENWIAMTRWGERVRSRPDVDWMGGLFQRKPLKTMP